MKDLPYKILIVEDDRAIMSLLAASFDDNHKVLSAYTMKEARENLKTNRPDLVILDRGLPDGDGLELCADIRKDPRYRSLPLLMLTGRVATDEKVLGLKLGADDYLTKPFELAELRARVGALLRRTEEPPRRLIKKSLWKY